MHNRVPHPPCTACGQVDDHPRHVAVNSLTDDSLNTNLHLDCCVEDGGCEGCESTLALVGDRRGDEMVAHLTHLHSQKD